MPTTDDHVARLLDRSTLEAVDVLADRIKASREALLAHLATRGLEITLQEIESAADR